MIVLVGLLCSADVFQVAVLESEPSLCVDENEHCAEWGSRGECTANSVYMEKACPASCGTCTVLSDKQKGSPSIPEKALDQSYEF